MNDAWNKPAKKQAKKSITRTKAKLQPCAICESLTFQRICDNCAYQMGM